ncbi:hypothetical protein EDD11_001015 [Mortierella claussenii]|nr:hypothetical protein EDD11_001015 [Mortierella claussenii]
MRLKRHKDYKRYMNMYCQTFHFRKPYQVIVVTPCTMALLKSRGEDASGAFLASKRFEKRRCKHQTAVDESICLSEIISTHNPHNYVIASQSKKLRVAFAKVPGVPLLYINRSNMILEPPSEASLQTGKKIESDKMHVKDKELQTLKAVKVTALGKVSVDPKRLQKLDAKKETKKQKLEIKKAKILKKRMGPKEPNPLSVKKKKVKPTTAPTTKPKEEKKEETSGKSNSKKRAAEGDAASSGSGSGSGSKATTTATASSGDGAAPEKKKRKRRKPKSAYAQPAGDAAGGSEAAGTESSS